MASKTLENAARLTIQVETALNEHVRPSAGEIDETLKKLGRKPYELGPKVEDASANLRASFNVYETADNLVVTEVGQDETVRSERNEDRDDLRSKVSELANASEIAFGRKAVEKLGLSGVTPKSPDDLISMATRFLAKTEGGILDLGEPRQKWNVPNVEMARAEIKEAVEALKKSRGDVLTDVRETQKARNDRNRVMNQWYLDVRFGADLARSILRRAGRDELATKVVPPSREIESLRPEEVPEETEEKPEK